MSIKSLGFSAIIGLGLINAAVAGTMPAINNGLHQATYIKLIAKNGEANKVSDFLQTGAKLVRETEPNTKFWFALQNNGQIFGIFDVFADDAGRAAHFDGKVAAALKDNAGNLIVGGWDKGVLDQVQNSEILSTNAFQPNAVLKSTKASYILIKALPGKEGELAAMLTNAASLVTKTEPATLFWLALKIDNQTYAIFDTFADNAGRDAHFAGQVAAALKLNAERLIEGGWENGVVKNISNFDVVASS